MGDLMLSDEEVRRRLVDLMPRDDAIDCRVEATDRVVMLTMSGGRPRRQAVVSRADHTQYSLKLDDGYLRSRVNEDLTDDEVVSELSDLISIGESYVRHGGTKHASRFLKVPYLVIRVNNEDVQVYRPGLFGRHRRSATARFVNHDR